MLEHLDNLAAAGLVLGIVALVLILLAVGILTTPRHRADCKNPYCSGCGGGPR